MDSMQNMGGKNVCSCPHHKTLPVLVMPFGLVFLLGAVGALDQRTVNIVWPILVMLGGAFSMAEGSMCKCC